MSHTASNPPIINLWPNQKPQSQNLSIEGLVDFQRRKFREYQKILLERYQEKRIESPLLTLIESLEDCRALGLIEDKEYFVKGLILKVREMNKALSVQIGDSTSVVVLTVVKERVEDWKSIVPGGVLGFIIKIRDNDQIARSGTKKDHTRSPLEGYLASKTTVHHYLVGELVFPSFRKRVTKRDPLGKGIVVLADIHCGSKTHIAGDFISMIDHINSDKSIGYVIIAGDTVDGKYVYRDHEYDLEVVDISAQYEMLGSYLASIRPDIKIALSMGNHDGMSNRKQPQIWPQEIISTIKSFRPDVLFVSNPGFVQIGEYRFLIYHGASFDPLIAQNESLSYDRPELIADLLLKYRNLCPPTNIVPIMPTSNLYHVVPEDTDYLLTGHIHKRQVAEIHAGRYAVCAGAWQHLTDFQKRVGFLPDYSIMDVIYPGNPEKDYCKNFTSDVTDKYKHSEIN